MSEPVSETKPQEAAQPAPAVSMDAHNLMPPQVRVVMPTLGSTSSQRAAAIAQVKWFTPDSNWTWYVIEFDGRDECFGVVDGFEVEMGSFSLYELQSARGPLGLKLERDLYFKPRPISEVAPLREWIKMIGWD